MATDLLDLRRELRGLIRNWGMNAGVTVDASRLFEWALDIVNATSDLLDALNDVDDAAQQRREERGALTRNATVQHLADDAWSALADDLSVDAPVAVMVLVDLLQLGGYEDTAQSLIERESDDHPEVWQAYALSQLLAIRAQRAEDAAREVDQ